MDPILVSVVAGLMTAVAAKRVHELARRNRHGLRLASLDRSIDVDSRAFDSDRCSATPHPFTRRRAPPRSRPAG